MSSLNRSLLSPPAPSNAAGFVDDNFAVVDLRRSRRGFSLASSAVTQLPIELVTPAFDALNIQDTGEMAQIVAQTAEAAGLLNKKRWSVALPETTSRTLGVKPQSKTSNPPQPNAVN